MHAILREATYATDTPVHESREFKEFQALHARQPGYVGSYVIDAGDGRLFTVTLWESPTHAAAARAVLEPVVRRVLHPLMNAPSRLLATGPVVRHDAAGATGAPI